MDSDRQGDLELGAMIGALRDELLAAQSAGGGSALRFRLDEVEVEATVVVTRGREGRGGIRFWVVEAGGGLSASDAATHRVRVKLHPLKDTAIADEEATPPT